MATLLERLTNSIPNGDPEPRIPIHGFMSAINEYRRGKLTSPEFIAMFSLTAGQQTSMQTLYSYLQAAPDKLAFLRSFKDILYLGELNADARYRTQAWVVQRLQDEVTDQGGTLP